MADVVDLSQRVAALRTKIDAAKTKKATLEGSRNAELKRLKELGCDSVEQAQDEIDELNLTIPKLDAEIVKEVTALELQLEQIENPEAEAV